MGDLSDKEAIARVIRAASSDIKLGFVYHASMDVGTLTGELAALAQKFKDDNDGSWRRWFAGGEEAGKRVVAEHDALITRVARQVAPNHAAQFGSLLRATMFVENDYNGGTWWGDKTPLPMNVNYGLWKAAFVTYNRQHPEAPLTAESIRNNPEHNVMAGAIILSTIDAAIDPTITGPTRLALIASAYGNTGDTLNHGPIPYGAMVMQEAYKRYQLAVADTEVFACSVQDLEVSAPVVPNTIGKPAPCR